MGQETVLVIENDQLLRELYGDYFKHEQFSVDTAVIGQETEEKLKQGGWDVVLLDVGIARLDVFAVLETYKRALLAAPSKKQPVFIVILMYEDQTQKALEFADVAFTKTHFTPGDVLETMRECLQKRQELHAASLAA